MTRTLRPAEGGEAGLATLGHILTAFYNVDPPVETRQMHMWAKRRTKNKNGVPFPAPSRVIEGARPPQPSRLFSVTEVLAWYMSGVPDMYGIGWKVPDERR
jgi:hypothetical protein